MGHSKSLNSYRDVREIFERAVSEGGVFIECTSAGQAINLRARLNHFRALDRDSMAQIYPPGHENHGISPYDPFVVRIEDNTLIIQPREVGGYVVKPLSERPPKPEGGESDILDHITGASIK